MCASECFRSRKFCEIQSQSAIASASTIEGVLQTSECVHALNPQACLPGCGSGRTIETHLTSQWHRQAGNAPIAEASHRPIPHPADDPWYQKDPRRSEASADRLIEGSSFLLSSALAVFPLFFSAAFGSALSSAFGSAFAGCTFGSWCTFFGTTFGRAFASATLGCGSRLTFGCRVRVLCGNRQSQSSGSQGGQRGQFQTCLHFDSFRSKWMNVRWLFASSGTKRVCDCRTVRDKKIFFCWRTVCAGFPLLEVFNERRHP